MKYKKQLLMCALIGLLAYVISDQWFQFLMVQGESMYPSYHNYQITILDKRCQDFQRGDVIAFQCEGVHSLLVKRIAAVPHDTVKIVNGVLYVNHEWNDKVMSKGRIEDAGILRETVVLLENEYFVLGDNYEKSKDSRHKKIGRVKRSSIVGRILPHVDG